MRLDGRRVIVTGAGSGMGRGLTMAFPALGAQVVAMDVNETTGRQVAEEAGVRFIACEVSDEASVNAAFDEAAAALGGLDVLVHAAGISMPANAPPTLELWNRVMGVNATGTFLTNIAAARHMEASGGGQILNFGSSAGVSAYPEKPAYSASKGAVAAFSRTMAAKWGKQGITVNVILPGMRTPLYDALVASLTPEAFQALVERSGRPIDRIGEIETDLVPLLAFLSSASCRYITGQMISIDGGALMVR
jgi:NAD(P)-dependent dehydrogenase (short-subunit alcohol dehydrogenase family)